MERTETCTAAERALLDALAQGLPRTFQGCPICNYDGLGPATDDIKTAWSAWLREIGGPLAEKTISWFEL